MARIQILELPTVHRDDAMETPFVLILDQIQDIEAMARHMGSGTAWEAVGARAVLAFEESIEIPANTITTDAGEVVARVRVEPDLVGFGDALAEQLRTAQAQVYTTGPAWCCEQQFLSCGRRHSDSCPNLQTTEG